MLQVQIVHFLVRKYYFEKAFPHYTEVLMLKKQLYGISGWEARLLGCKLIREQKIAKLTGMKKKMAPEVKLSSLKIGRENTTRKKVRRT